MSPKGLGKTQQNGSNESLALTEIIDLLVRETPSLESLNREELKTVAKAYVFESLKDNLKRRVEIEKIDYQGKRELFVIRCSKKSKQTSIAYGVALDLLDDWAARAGIHILDMKANNADAFIESLIGAPSTVRLRVAAVSSFFTFLERETDGRVQNPFRGTKVRPGRKTKTPVVPTEEEIDIIMSRLSPIHQAAVVVMKEVGLRIGALDSLSIRNGKYTAFSKGKEISGMFPNAVLKVIKGTGLDTKQPFGGLPYDSIRCAFKYQVGKLVKEGLISAPYSVHDLRHFYAIQEYMKDKDIYRLKVLLNHASIMVTENYLRGVEAYWA
jgi:integrase